MDVYNTGKVKIGLGYTRPNIVEMSEDEVIVQRGLLGVHKSPLSDAIATIVVVFGIAALATWWSA
jgi:hypothetical protein